MRTITTITTAYTFRELSDEAKQKAIQNLWNINDDCEWWGFTSDKHCETTPTGFTLG